MKTHIVVGQRFHSLLLADTLAKLGSEVLIYTSSFPKKFRSERFSHPTKFIPLFGGIIRHLTGIRIEALVEREIYWFGKLAKWSVGESDVLYGWAGYALECARLAKHKGKLFFLERSCPHLLAQEQIIEAESAALQVPYKGKSQRWVSRSLEEYSLADRIVVPSMYSYRSFKDRGFSDQQLVLARLDKPSLRLPPKRPKARGEFVVGSLGGNVVRKGFQYLFEAWEKLNLPNSRLLVKAPIADLQSSPVLNNYLRRLKNVEVLGYLDDISDFYRRCDVFCLPSVDDGFGLVTLEAMAHSLPVIITENVGAADIIRGNSCGFIVPAFDSEAIQGKLEQLYRDRELTARMGAKGYQEAMRLGQNDECSYESSIMHLYKDLVFPRLSQSSHTILSNAYPSVR